MPRALRAELVDAVKQLLGGPAAKEEGPAAGPSTDELKARINARGEELRKLKMASETTRGESLDERMARLDKIDELQRTNRADVAALTAKEKAEKERPAPRTKPAEAPAAAAEFDVTPENRGIYEDRARSLARSVGDHLYALKTGGPGITPETVRRTVDRVEAMNAAIEKAGGRPSPVDRDYVEKALAAMGKLTGPAMGAMVPSSREAPGGRMLPGGPAAEEKAAPAGVEPGATGLSDAEMVGALGKLKRKVERGAKGFDLDDPANALSAWMDNMRADIRAGHPTDAPGAVVPPGWVQEVRGLIDAVKGDLQPDELKTIEDGFARWQAVRGLDPEKVKAARHTGTDHELTQKQYVARRVRQQTKGIRVVGATGASHVTTMRRDAANEHKAAVLAALAAGKSVPPEVLADYPDLAAKAGDRLAWADYGRSASGKQRWKDDATGAVRYQEKMPGERKPVAAKEESGVRSQESGKKAPKKAPAAKKAAPKAKAERPAVADVVAHVEGLREGGATPEGLATFADHLAGMTVVQLGELKKALGLKASGKKALLVEKIKAGALAAVAAPAEKKAAPKAEAEKKAEAPAADESWGDTPAQTAPAGAEGRPRGRPRPRSRRRRASWASAPWRTSTPPTCRRRRSSTTPTR